MELLINLLLKARFLLLCLFRPSYVWKEDVISPDGETWLLVNSISRFDDPVVWMMGRPGYEDETGYYPIGGHAFLLSSNNPSWDTCEVFMRDSFTYGKVSLRICLQQYIRDTDCFLAPLWITGDNNDQPEYDFEISKGRLLVTNHYGYGSNTNNKKRSRANHIPFINFCRGIYITFSFEVTPYYVNYLVNGICIKRTRWTSSDKKHVVISIYRPDESTDNGLMVADRLSMFRNSNVIVNPKTNGRSTAIRFHRSPGSQG